MPLDDATLQSLARYLDGELAGAALKDFERCMREDATLRREVEVQSQIAWSLQRNFNAPTVSRASVLALVARSAAPVGKTAAGVVVRRGGMSLLGRLSVAAALLAGVGGMWMTWQYLKPESMAQKPFNPQAPRTAAEYYAARVTLGFEPDWVCANDQEFAQTFRDHIGQALVLKPASDDTKMLGLAYTRIFSPMTIAMLAKVDGQPVVVLIDRLSSDNHDVAYPGCAGLNVFRREIGSLVAYEISPRPEAHMLDLLTQPEPAASSGGN